MNIPRSLAYLLMLTGLGIASFRSILVFHGVPPPETGALPFLLSTVAGIPGLNFLKEVGKYWSDIYSRWGQTTTHIPHCILDTLTRYPYTNQIDDTDIRRNLDTLKIKLAKMPPPYGTGHIFTVLDNRGKAIQYSLFERVDVKEYLQELRLDSSAVEQQLNKSLNRIVELDTALQILREGHSDKMRISPLGVDLQRSEMVLIDEQHQLYEEVKLLKHNASEIQDEIELYEANGVRGIFPVHRVAIVGSQLASLFFPRILSTITQFTRLDSQSDSTPEVLSVKSSAQTLLEQITRSAAVFTGHEHLKKIVVEWIGLHFHRLLYKTLIDNVQHSLDGIYAYAIRLSSMADLYSETTFRIYMRGICDMREIRCELYTKDLDKMFIDMQSHQLQIPKEQWPDVTTRLLDYHQRGIRKLATLAELQARKDILGKPLLQRVSEALTTFTQLLLIYALPALIIDYIFGKNVQSVVEDRRHQFPTVIVQQYPMVADYRLGLNPISYW